MLKSKNYSSVILIASSIFINISLLADSSKNRTEIVDKETHFFELKQPIPLAAEEKSRPALERVQEKFIGDIPPEIASAISYLSNQKAYLDNDIKISNRVLLHGEPGTGKTHLFKIIAQELQVPYLHFSASFFLDNNMGEVSHKIRQTFSAAKDRGQPVMLLIDNIDAISAKRGTLLTLLAEVQELSENKNVFIMVAANDIKSLDNAITDKFPATCHIKRLNRDQRQVLFMKLFKDKGLPLNQELAERLADATEKYKCAYMPDSEKNVYPDDQKKHWKDYSYSNRDLEHIVTTGKERQFTDCEINKRNCTKKLCAYFAEVINGMGKIGKDVKEKRVLNCDGIN